MSYIKMIRILLYSLLILFFTNCSNTGSGTTLASTVAATGTAILLDAPVSGITFNDGYANATTGLDGSFTFTVGTPVTFSLGDIVLGSFTPTSAATSVVSLVDLVLNATGTSDPYVQQLSVLLLTLDQDRNPANGIQISAATVQAAIGQTVDFTNPASVIALLNAIAPAVAPVTAAQATAHMNAVRFAAMMGAYNGSYGGNCTAAGAVTGSWTVTIGRNGVVTGTANEATATGIINHPVSGSITAMGNLNATMGGAAGTAVWAANITLDGNVSGTWTDPAFGCTGTELGNKSSNTIANYIGTYQGIFSGADNGTWIITVNTAGNITGTGVSQALGAFSLTGSTNSSGGASMAQALGGTSTGSSFTGVFNPFGGVIGTWSDATGTATGQITGFRN